MPPRRAREEPAEEPEEETPEQPQGGGGDAPRMTTGTDFHQDPMVPPPDDAHAREGAVTPPDFGRGYLRPPVPPEVAALERVIGEVQFNPDAKKSLWAEWYEYTPDRRTPDVLKVALLSRGVNAYVADYIVKRVFPYGMQVPYPGAQQPPGYPPQYPPQAAPMVSPVADAQRRRQEYLDEIRQMRMELQEQRMLDTLMAQTQGGNGGGGGVNPQMLSEMLVKGVELGRTGMAGADIVALFSKAVEIATAGRRTGWDDAADPRGAEQDEGGFPHQAARGPA